jgi:hypothetical protein
MESTTETTIPTPEVPKWVTETPDEITYKLEMTEWCTGENQDVESIDLNRDEFIKLKATLARLRGFDVPEVEAETAPAEAKQDQYEAEYLKTCLEIRENDEGSVTPFESFFTQLALAYGSGSRGPEQVRQSADEFQENWEAAVQHIRTVTRHCPELVKEAAAANQAA